MRIALATRALPLYSGVIFAGRVNRKMAASVSAMGTSCAFLLSRGLATSG